MRNLKFIIATVLLGLMASCSEDSMEIPPAQGKFTDRADGYVFVSNSKEHTIYLDFRNGTSVTARKPYLDDNGQIQRDCIDATYTIIEQSTNHIIMDIKFTWVSKDYHYEISIELDQAFTNPPRGYMITKNMNQFNDKREGWTTSYLNTPCD